MTKRGFEVIHKGGSTDISKIQSALLLPNTIFFDEKLAILESIVKYLKEKKDLNYKEIGEVLERDQRNIWTVYSRVKKKETHEVKQKPSEFLPLDILKDRTLSGFEVIVEHLKEVRKLSFHEIGLALNRDERNIWTIYSRAKQKRKKYE